MWFKSGNTSLDLREISTVTLLQEDEEKVVITMKNNQQIIFQPEDNVPPTIAYESITEMLESMRESEDRLIKKKLDLFNSVLSELRSISQNFKTL
jgi:precorrin-6B methylase 1